MNDQPKGENGRPEMERQPNRHKDRERARLSAALRENLKRRKAQARSRTAGEAPASGEKPHDSAGIAEHKRGG